jgi:hypothetical protein
MFKVSDARKWGLSGRVKPDVENTDIIADIAPFSYDEKFTS